MIGIIGSGHRITNLAGKLVRHDGTLAVTAVTDTRPEAAEEFRRTVAPGARVYGSYRELLADPSIRWVMIGSWNSRHREHIVAALEAGKHVFCEKPIATTIEDCIAIKKAELASGRQFMIGFTLRYSPHYRKIKELVDGGEIGKIVSFEFNETLHHDHGGYIMADWRRLRENAGTHLLEKCCHDIDIANWITDSRVKRAASFGGLDFFLPGNAHHVERLGPAPGGKRAFMTWRSTTGLNPFTADKDILDNQVVIMEYENGIRATFHTNCNAGIPERRMYLLGTEGAIRSDVRSGLLELRRTGYTEEIRNLSTGVSGDHGEGDPVLIAHLARMMKEGVPALTSVDDGIAAAVTCFGIDMAQDTGTVADLAPLWRAYDAAAGRKAVAARG